MRVCDCLISSVWMMRGVVHGSGSKMARSPEEWVSGHLVAAFSAWDPMRSRPMASCAPCVGAGALPPERSSTGRINRLSWGQSR